jgi:hypothetical protein
MRACVRYLFRLVSIQGTDGERLQAKLLDPKKPTFEKTGSGQGEGVPFKYPSCHFQVLKLFPSDPHPFPHSQSAHFHNPPTRPNSPPEKSRSRLQHKSPGSTDFPKNCRIFFYKELNKFVYSRIKVIFVLTNKQEYETYTATPHGYPPNSREGKQ